MKIEILNIPDIEILAALRMSKRTAEREGFFGTATQVQGYIDQLEKAAYEDRKQLRIALVEA